MSETNSINPEDSPLAGNTENSVQNPGYIEAERSLLDDHHADTAPSPAEIEKDVSRDVNQEREEEDSPRDGYAVYEPPHVDAALPHDTRQADEYGKEEQPDEWFALEEEIFARYGDSLTGMAGYMGPVGGLLAVIGGAIIGISVAFETASNVISAPVLLGSGAASIIGIFLLVFHLFHWLSNRTKGLELARSIHNRLLARSCRHLDIGISGGEKQMVLNCDYFGRELSDVPECVVCPHYSPVDMEAGQPDESVTSGSGQNGSVDNDGGTLHEDGQEGEPRVVVVSRTLSQLDSPSKDRKLLDELEPPRIGGESGGDLDEAVEESAAREEKAQSEFVWEDTKKDG
jgi:hypothetical protein